MADYSGLFGTYSNLQQPAQDPFAPLLAPPTLAAPPPVLSRPNPRASFAQQQQQTQDVVAQSMLATAAKKQAQQDFAAAEASKIEANRANQERTLAEERAKIDEGVNARQQQLVAEATQLGNKKLTNPFKEASTGAKLATGIFAFLSGVMDPKGAPTRVGAWMDGIIQRDLARQMADIDQQNKMLGVKQGALDKDYGRAQNALDMKLQATVRTYDGAMRLMQQQAAKLGPSAMDEAQQGIAQLQQSLNAQLEQDKIARGHLATSQAGVALQRRAQDMNWAQNEADRMERIGNNAMKAQAAGAAAKGAGPGAPEGLTPKEARELVVHGADGRVLGYARNAAAAEKVSDRIEQYEDFRRDLVTYAKMIKENGREFSGVAGYGKSKKFAEMESLHTRILLTAKEKAKLGVLSGPDLDLMTKQLPAPRSLLGGTDPLPGVTNAMKQLDESQDRFMKIHVPGAERYSPPSFDDFGGAQDAGVAPGEGRTKNSIPLSLRPQDLGGQQTPGISAVSGLPTADSTPFNPLASPWGR